MCVLFDPETIYKNAFFAIENDKSFAKLYKKDIVDFCNILEEEITKKSTENVKYKYVYFDFNESSLSSFYNNYFGFFNEIGDDIYLSEKIEEKEIESINFDYEECIKEAIKKAREIFKSKLSFA